MEFTPTDWKPTVYSGESKEALLQWNLDTNLECQRFRYSGHISTSSPDDYMHALEAFLKSAPSLGSGVVGIANIPLKIQTEELRMSVMNMDFFNKLNNGTESKILPQSKRYSSTSSLLYPR
jgi:hypothetical protein